MLWYTIIIIMREYWLVILEALIDTAKILPLLFVVYYLIELIEFKNANKIQKSKLLKGKASPVAGALLGSVPQCGFSIVSTDLFSKGKLSVGALIAVYIATSDEAVPLMIASPKHIGWMFLLIVIKIVVAILVGYLANWLFGILFKVKNGNLIAEENEHGEEEEEAHGGCCHHHLETKSFDWLHPLLHCLKISLFIFIINILFGMITDIWVGGARLAKFLTASKYIQPILAIAIGFIPNCASSVVLTELFLMNGLSFGALLAGLCVNAGLGVIMLIRQNKNLKANMFIISTMVITGLVLGYGLIWI